MHIKTSQLVGRKKQVLDSSTCEGLMQIHVQVHMCTHIYIHIYICTLHRRLNRSAHGSCKIHQGSHLQNLSMHLPSSSMCNDSRQTGAAKHIKDLLPKHRQLADGSCKTQQGSAAQTWTAPVKLTSVDILIEGFLAWAGSAKPLHINDHAHKKVLPTPRAGHQSKLRGKGYATMLHDTAAFSRRSHCNFEKSAKTFLKIDAANVAVCTCLLKRAMNPFKLSSAKVK